MLVLPVVSCVTHPPHLPSPWSTPPTAGTSTFPLHRAVRRGVGREELKKFLNAHLVSERDSDGQTALHVACQQDDSESALETIKIMLARAAKERGKVCS
jgi:ankyrin repeat protein